MKKSRNQNARNQGKISEHDDLIKHESFFLIFKVMPVSVQSDIHIHDV